MPADLLRDEAAASLSISSERCGMKILLYIGGPLIPDSTVSPQEFEAADATDSKQ